MSHTGSCSCGAVTFRVQGDLAGLDACHCTACRKYSGHFFVSTDVPRSSVTIEGDQNITWFQSSKRVRRGFCSRCGSSLFWDPIGRDWTGIAMGVFDGPTKTRIHVHVYTSEKGDYYDIADGSPQCETVPPVPQ